MSIWFAILLFCCVNMTPEGSSGFQIDLGGQEQHVITRQKDNSWKVESRAANNRQRSYTFSCKGTEMTFVGLVARPAVLNLEEIIGQTQDWAAFKSIEYKGASLTLDERTAETLSFTQSSKEKDKVLDTKIKVTFAK